MCEKPRIPSDGVCNCDTSIKDTRCPCDCHKPWIEPELDFTKPLEAVHKSIPMICDVELISVKARSRPYHVMAYVGANDFLAYFDKYGRSPGPYYLRNKIIKKKITVYILRSPSGEVYVSSVHSIAPILKEFTVEYEDK